MVAGQPGDVRLERFAVGTCFVAELSDFLLEGGAVSLGLCLEGGAVNLSLCLEGGAVNLSLCLEGGAVNLGLCLEGGAVGTCFGADVTGGGDDEGGQCETHGNNQAGEGDRFLAGLGHGTALQSYGLMGVLQ